MWKVSMYPISQRQAQPEGILELLERDHLRRGRPAGQLARQKARQDIERVLAQTEQTRAATGIGIE
jgi:hypothetical protein